jgi:hypothetical protein
MSAENEIKAMSAISSVLEDLETDARARVLYWAMSRYGIDRAGQNRFKTPSEGAGPPSSHYGSFAELFDAAKPNTEREKAMVAAYWLQVCQNAESFQSQSLNDLLKDLGHGIGNITEALNQLKNDRPALLLQLKKSGSSRQARKTYKLTQVGARRVEAMTQGVTAEEAN